MNILSGIGSLGTQVQKQIGKPDWKSLLSTGAGIFSSIFGKKEVSSSPISAPIYPVYAQAEKADSTFLYIALGGIMLMIIFLLRR